MKALISILSIIFVMMVSGFAFADTQTQKGFVKISKDRELFVDYVAPKAGQPTLIILNGLTYSTTDWDAFIAPLQKRGVGLLRYDMFGMGQTLLKYAPTMATISFDSQVQDLKKLLTVMDIKGPYNLVGLSYGGGIGLGFAKFFPEDVKNLIMMAPFTEQLAGMDTWIKSQIWATRQMYPMNPSSDDQLYDYFLHQIVYATYPQAEPSVLNNPYILESVFRMVQGIRKVRPVDFVGKITVPMHLMVAEKDQYIPGTVLQTFWDKVPAKDKMSRIFVKDSEHKICEAVPNFAASWVYQITTGNELLFKGDDFQGFPLKGEATSAAGSTIRLTGGKE
jgi:pimeloyl-ACP methyl ester carboxylesterase